MSTVSQVDQETGTQPKLLPNTSEVKWTPDMPLPPGVSVDSLRRRGIDVLRITIDKPKPKGLLSRLFGSGSRKQNAGGTVVTIADGQIRIEITEPGEKNVIKKAIAFGDVTSINVHGASGSSRQAVRIGYRGKEVMIGAGLPEATLHWLRDRLLLETAGLVWKPLFNVGRRTTQKTCNPDNDRYTSWGGGPNRLIEVFLKDAPEHMRSFEAALDKEDWDKARQDIHWMKSSSAFVGAIYLSELCQRMELDLHVKEFSRTGVLRSHIVKEFEKVVGLLARIDRKEPAGVSAAAADGLPPAADPVQGPLSGTRILVVDDSRVNQEVAREYLEEAGSSLAFASSGDEALALVAEEKFDLILMDCQMPGKDGFETTRMIRSRELRAMRPRTPVIALTAHALSGDRDICLGAGMDDYLSKPYTPEEIVAMLQKWLGVGAPAAPAESGAEPGAEVVSEAASEPLAAPELAKAVEAAPIEAVEPPPAELPLAQSA